MPRVARKNLETSFFHIMVQGINKDYIFNTNRNKKVYINALNKYEKECNVEILAYCIMDNHAHMLVYSDRIADMSKFMHFVNGFYAGYYNKINSRIGYVNVLEPSPFINQVELLLIIFLYYRYKFHQIEILEAGFDQFQLLL